MSILDIFSDPLKAIEGFLPSSQSVFNAGASYLGQNQTNQVNSANTAATNQSNMDIARMNNEFQSNMSNTSYQRSVQDMVAAGLNPMLAYSKGGASTPTGSVPTMQTAQYSSPITAGVNGALAGQKLDNETKQTVANILRLRTQNDLTKEEIRSNQLQQEKIAEETNTQKEYTRETKARADKGEVEAKTAAIEQQIKQTELANLPKQQQAQLAALLASASASNAQAQLTAVNELLAKTKLPGAQANEEIDKFLGVWGAAGERLLKAIGLGAGVYMGLRKVAAPLPTVPKFNSAKSGSVTIHNYPMNGSKSSTTWQGQ